MITEALVVAKPGAPFHYQTVELDDTLRTNEVLVRIKATGVCHTDLTFAAEKSIPALFPAIFGHEGAGIVERIGSRVTMASPGDHVIVTYSCCGKCKYCRRKESSYCERWFRYNFGMARLDGSTAVSSPVSGAKVTSHFFGQSSFAKHIVVAETGVVPVDKHIPFDTLAPLGCGVMTGAGAMLNAVNPTPDMAVVVVGVGSVGLSAIMALRLLQHPPRTIIAVDRLAARLKLARTFGATHGVNATVRRDLARVLKDITNGRGVDGAIDTTGNPTTIKALFQAAARKGKVVAVGVGDLTAEASHNIFDLVNSGCSYLGCNQGDCFPQEFLPELLTAYQLGKFPFDRLVTQYPARELESAAQDVRLGRTVKAVLVWD